MKEATPELVKAEFARRMSELSPEAQKNFRQRFLVHDYESFPDDTLLVTLDVKSGTVYPVWGTEQIRRHLRIMFLRDEDAVLAGYNSKKFDNRITDAILDGADEASVKALSDRLIVSDDEDVFWRSGDKGRFRPDWVGRTFDIGFDIGQKKIGTPPNEKKIPEVSLKRWERLNGYRVMRSSVPFDRRHLTKAERDEVVRYCVYDVCATALCMLSDEAWDPCLNARRTLVDEYGHKGVDWEMTKPRMTGVILNASEDNFAVPEDWDLARYPLPGCIRIAKNRDILRAYTEKTFRELRELSNRKAGGPGVANKDVCGIPHLYGIGGVHGCAKGVWQGHGGGIWSLDAASLYPNIMRHYDFLSRRIVGDDRKGFGDLIDLRVKVYKPAGDKRAEGLKLVLNGSFGGMGFDKADMYDPRNFCCVTITGQLLITDFLEKAERHVELVQSNTDGVFFRLRDASPAGMAALREIVSAFERRTKLEMEWTEFESMYQRDVSNYVARQVPKPGKPAGSGKLKKKGTWFGLKHCTVTPYLYESRVHAALNGGARLSPDGFDMDRFAIEIKRDKNSRCFLVGGREDHREWLDVVPVVPNSGKAVQICVLLKDKPSYGTIASSNGYGAVAAPLFEEAGKSWRRRKATGCPEFAALAEDVAVADVDLKWYEAAPPEKKAAGADEDSFEDFV